MGLFDFGDRAVVQNLAYRVGVGIQQIEDEIRKSPMNATPLLRGLAFTVREERIKMMQLYYDLQESTRNSLVIEFKGRKIPFWDFFTELVPISSKVKDLTNIRLLD